MTEVIRAAAELQAVCDAERWRYCFIGGLAVLRWGEARETVDADLTLLTGFGAEGILIRHGRQMDWPYIHSQLKPLVELKESPEILAELERRRKECER